MNKKELDYYLQRFLDIELKKSINVSENTIISYKFAFISLLEFIIKNYNKNIKDIKIETINKKVIIEYLNYLELVKKNSISTRNQRLAAIKSFYNYLALEEIEYLPLCNDILSIKTKKIDHKTVKYLSKEGVKEILSLPNTSTKQGIRNLAILTLLYDSGARIQELITLNICDLNLKNKTLNLYGKGRKNRTIPLLRQTIKILEKYIKIYKMNFNSPSLLFFNSKKEALSRMGVTYIINKYVKIAKKKNPIEFQIKVTPHIFRHSKAMHLLESGVNLIYIRDFLGHESVTTTEIYAKANPEIKRKAIETNSQELSKTIQFSDKEKKDLLWWLKNSLKEN